MDNFWDTGRSSIFDTGKSGWIQKGHSVSQKLSNPLPTFFAYSYLTLKKTPKGFEVGPLILNTYWDIFFQKSILVIFLKKFEKNIFYFSISSTRMIHVLDLQTPEGIFECWTGICKKSGRGLDKFWNMLRITIFIKEKLTWKF